LSADQLGAQSEGDSSTDRPPSPEDVETPYLRHKIGPSPNIAGTLIGQYRLIQLLGHGGMGEVWLADQRQPVQRRVAIKLIKAGMDTHEVVARFESERQALARMDHPAIAKVFDAGSTAEGRPFFAMEYVKGIPITAYCDAHKLTTRQRLELFMHVCDAVQHAHQKAILHRDLKPSNILVGEIDGHPAPRIIDFGVAKATTPGLDGDSLFTRAGTIIGTPGYMSPEQADSAGVDVDTRTDVYSLGVILYELLVGALPIDFSSTPIEQIQRKLREEDAPRPSTKLRTQHDKSSEAAEKRGTDFSTLERQLRGDLDAIALKALEKDRARRYATPADLASDIGRYLRHEPVLARPAGVWYLARKYIRRNRVGVGVGATAALLLIAFGVAQTLELRRVRRERDRADRVTEFMTDMFKVSDPSEARGNDIRAREILDKASDDIDKGLAQDPELQAQMMDVMGNVYQSLGLYAKSESLLRRSVEIRRRTLGPDHPDTLKSMFDLASVLNEDSKYSEADKLARQTLDIRRRVLGPQNRDTLEAMSRLAYVTQNEGRYAPAEKMDRDILAIAKRKFGPGDKLYQDTLTQLAIVFAYQGKFSDSESTFRELLKLERQKLPPDSPRVLDDTANLASVLLDEGHYAEAEKLYREVLPTLQRIRGPDHPRTLLVQGNLALALHNEKRDAEAEKLFRQTLAIKRKKLGPEHRSTLVTVGNLADVLTAEGKYAEAEQLVRQNLAAEQRTLGPDHTDTLATMLGLAELLKKEKHYSESEAVYLQTLDGLRRAVGPNHPDTAGAAYELATVLAREGKRDAAFANLQFAVQHELSAGTRQGLAMDPDLESLHSDPRFAALVASSQHAGAAH